MPSNKELAALVKKQGEEICRLGIEKADLELRLRSACAVEGEPESGHTLSTLQGFPAVAIVVATQAYHLLGGWKGLLPPLFSSLGAPDGTTWVSHADLKNRIVKLEAKRHYLRKDLPTEVDTYWIEFKAFENIMMAATKVVAFSINGEYKTSITRTYTPRQIFAMSRKDFDTHFLALERKGETDVHVFDQLDEPFEVQDGDILRAQQFTKEAAAEPEAPIEPEVVPDTRLQEEMHEYQEKVLRQRRLNG